MRRLIRGTLLTLAIVSWTLVSASSGAQTTAGRGGLRVEWPQDQSDIKPDPAARFGRLPNGMSYVIYRNATPPGTVSIHLRIAAGSLVEDDDQRGLAHFVEHLAFNGSKHIPKDQLLPMLQQHGLKIGPDAGAFTTATKTEYVFDLPKNDKETLDTAFFVLRETASELVMEPAAIEREREVILGEERLRDNPKLRAAGVWLAAAFAGQKYATRGIPIGRIEVIKTAKRQAILDFYHAFYRPELTTVVVVGDIDPDAIEAEIRAKFADWTGVGPAKAVDFGAYRAKGLTTLVHAEKGLPDQLTAAWFKPFDDRAQTERMEFEQIEDMMLVGILARRFQHASEQPESSFLSAAPAEQAIYKTANVVQLTVMPKTAQQKAALIQALGMLRQYVTYGVNQDELDQMLKNLDNFFSSTVSGGKTRNNEEIVKNVISNLDENSVFTSPEQDLQAYQTFKPNLTRAALNARLKEVFAGDGPLLAHMGQDLTGLDEPDLRTAYAQAQAQPLSPYGAVASKPWPYSEFGTPRRPVSQQTDAKVGFTRFQYPNGVKLNVMPTKFKDDQILVSVRFGGGMEKFSPTTKAPIRFANFYALAGGLVAGGLGKLDQDEMRTTLAGRTANLTFAIGDDAAVFAGATTRRDLAIELQLLMAFTTDAAYRPEFYNRMHPVIGSIYEQLANTPQSLLAVMLPGLTDPDDARTAFPSPAQAYALSFDQIKSAIQASLSDAPIEITIVGDVGESEAVTLVSQTFATLPTLPSRAVIAPGGDHAAFPTGDLERVLHHQGRDDQSVSLIAWPTTDNLSDPKTSSGLRILTEVLNQRLWEEVRERLGQAYDAGASLDQSWVFKGYGMIQAQGSVAAGEDAAFVAAVNHIANDLQTRPITQDELDRARKPLLERWETAQKTNEAWIGVIPHAIEDRTRLDFELNQKRNLMLVTPEDVEALAKTYLVSSRALHVSVLPRPKVIKTTSDK